MIRKLVVILLLSMAPWILFAEELHSVEPRLIKAISNINQERIDDALVDVQDLIKNTPQFDLAQLVYADLLMAKAGMPGRLGLSPANTSNTRMASLRDEARVRWQRYQENLDATKLPDVLLQLSASQKTAVVADLSRSRLYLYENDAKGPRLLSDFYVTQGKNGKGMKGEELITDRCTSCHRLDGETDDEDSVAPELRGWASIKWIELQIRNPGNLVAQVEGCFTNILAVLKEADAKVEDITRMRIFVMDADAYAAASKEIGAAYREHFGKWYPAMTLVQVARLYDKEALVEIEVDAVL